MLGEILEHSFTDILSMLWSFIMTKIWYPKATLIRRPFHIRHKAGLHYEKGFTTGRNCRIEVFGEGKIYLGENCRLGDNVHIVSSGFVRVGRECLMASKIFISDTSHGSLSSEGEGPDVPPNDRKLVSRPVVIGDNVWIGENVVILQGITIGDGCVIGANATVSRDLPANTVSVGSPAKPIKKYSEEQKEWVSIR